MFGGMFDRANEGGTATDGLYSDAALAEERQWKLIWDKLVASSKVGG